MSTNKNIESSKKVEEKYTDSGFHSGFQESCEISSRELDKETDMVRDFPDDKENFVDSGVISSECISTEMVIEDSPSFVPDYLTCRNAKPTHPLIEKYFDQDDNGFTQLHIAILHNILPAINTLIQLAPSSSYLDIRNFCGQTALHLAVLLDQKLVVKKLINAGADVNIRDNRCNTPLHLACLNENISCVQVIIAAVFPQKDKKLLANLEQWNYEGESSFYIASKLQNISIMRALESKGANVNAREGRAGYTALHIAVENKAKSVVKFLCEECNTLSMDTENYGGLTAFQISLLTDQEALADYLVSRGSTPYYTSEDSDMDDEDSSSDFSGDELEKNQIISKIAEIAVN